MRKQDSDERERIYFESLRSRVYLIKQVKTIYTRRTLTWTTSCFVSGFSSFYHSCLCQHPILGPQASAAGVPELAGGASLEQLQEQELELKTVRTWLFCLQPASPFQGLPPHRRRRRQSPCLQACRLHHRHRLILRRRLSRLSQAQCEPVLRLASQRIQQRA